MASTRFFLIMIILFHSSIALLSSTFHSDRETFKQRLLTKKRSWSPLVSSDYQQSTGSGTSGTASTASDTSTPNDDSVTAIEGTTVIDIKKAKLRNPVLRKCCKFGEEITGKVCVQSGSGGPPFQPIVYYNVTHHIDAPLSDLFTLVFGDPCLHGWYRLDPAQEPEDEFYLLRNGSLLQPAISTVLNGDEFCMEGFFKDEESFNDDNSVVLPLVCFPPPNDENFDEEIKWILYPVGLLLSIPFLVLILVMHIIIPKLHCTLNGKCLMCHISFLIVAYAGLATIQLSRSLLRDELCKALAFVVQFAFLASFCWLSAMCFSIWKIISHPVSGSFFTAERNLSETKSFGSTAFLKFSIGVLAIPVLLIMVSMIMDLTPSIPASYLKPQFGVESCWFLTSTAALPYFYGPIICLLVGNVVLFALTARKVFQKSRDETSLIRYENKAFKVCCSLFILMGINWTTEIISWATGNQGDVVLNSMWYFTDVCNALHGLLIFIIFIFDSEFRYLVKQKLSSWGRKSRSNVDEVDFNKRHHNFTMTSLLLSQQHNSG